MRMSPGSNSPASSCSVSSTTAAGTISHTTRGFCSFFTRSRSEVAGIAPSTATCLTESALRANATHCWPALKSRRTILPPILPSPIIPSCIDIAPVCSRDFLLYLRERIAFQVAGVAVKFADALGQFLGCHGVLVVHPTEGFFVQVQAFILACFRVNRIEATNQRAFRFFQLVEKVRTDGEQIAAGQADDLIHISETGAHYLSFVTEFLVVVVDAGDGRNARILV